VSAITQAPDRARVKPAPIALTAPAGLVLLVAAAVGVPLAISSWSGSLGIPHNDAWAYDQVATWFARTGHIHLVGWGSMFLVGQIVVLGPLAKFIVAQHLFVAATAAVALVATYMLLAPRIGRRGALLGSAVIAAWPGFGVLATSFMTDVPAFAAMMLTLALGDAALRRSSLRLLAGALAAGIWAFTIREQAVAALVAVSVAALADRTTRARTAAVVVPFATLCVGLEAWRRGLPNGDAPKLHLMPAAAVGHALASGWFTLALPLLPATVTIATERWRRRSWVAANTAVAVGLFLLTVGFFVGNYLSATVAFADGNAPRLIPGLPYLLVLLAGLISGAVLAGAVVERWRRLDTLLGTFTVLSVAILMVETALGQTLFDRYLIVLAPGCFALCMGDTRKPPRASYAALAGRLAARDRSCEGRRGLRLGGSARLGAAGPRRGVLASERVLPRDVPGDSVLRALGLADASGRRRPRRPRVSLHVALRQRHALPHEPLPARVDDAEVGEAELERARDGLRLVTERPADSRAAARSA
jgi:hypothetical protein